MSDRTGIEWTDATWNPLRGCSRVSAGCSRCYAEGVAARVIRMDRGRGVADGDGAYDGLLAKGGQWNGTIKIVDGVLDQPLRWRRPRRVFVNSMSDLFHEAVPDEVIYRIFAVMALAEWHTFQVLTKRPQRMRDFLRAFTFERLVDCCGGEDGASVIYGRTMQALQHHFGQIIGSGLKGFNRVDRWPLPNVWLGVSVEDQSTADERIPLLLDTPAAVRWLSMEPLLGPVDLLSTGDVLCRCDGCLHAAAESPDIAGLQRIDWVVVGGESGPHARPMHPDWAREIRRQCAANSVPFFLKQLGEWAPGECVVRNRGIVPVAWRVNDSWQFGEEDLAAAGGHIDDEPDLYRVGKKSAGRRLDGDLYDGYPDGPREQPPRLPNCQANRN
ncbi:phage Gp37/Gp68 family protein [Pseudomonas aeruginosa]|uniref:DUF5131 family protein n=1 Tax=Pseudomonas aeruginosa TaxID=287 RepID=UPI000F835A9A|nr:phage Gp37/Gp68 family protein [Pseudomonas aeruginosa]RTX31630.1 phage Gp37/Gp68 family protein [Pseudomonas aeruginosa]